MCTTVLPPFRRGCRGFTLIELLVVVSVIAILAGLLFPGIALLMKKAKQTKDGNNQRQIITTYIAASSEGFTIASGGKTFPTMPAVMSAADARVVTAATFEQLAARYTLGSRLFLAPGVAVQLPNPRAAGTDFNLAGGWADQSGDLGLAWDWAVPGDAGMNAVRVVMGDRHPAQWGRTEAVVTYGDGHALVLYAKPGPGAGPFQTDGAPWASGAVDLVVENPDARDPAAGSLADNIYDSNGDLGNPTVRGGGSATQCSLK